jgi:hypothetical protein
MIKRTKLLFVAMLLTIILNPAIAQNNQDDAIKQEKVAVTYPNIIKLNSLAVPFNNVALVYERAIISRVSAGIGVSYKVSGEAPSLFKEESEIIDARFDKINGFSITPEARYYLRTCEPSKLEGFYAGLYLRYTHLNSGVDFVYFTASDQVENYRADMTLNEFGAGIQLGYQILLWERFSIDFLFFGPRFSRYRMEYRFDPAPSPVFLGDLSDYLNDIIDRFGLDYNLELQPEGQYTANSSFSFANMRFGLSLGFAF